MELTLDDGGPFTVWQEEDSDGRRHGLLIIAHVCDNPDCDCRDIRLQAMEIDERFANITDDGGELIYDFIPRPGEPKDPPPRRWLSASLDVDSGQVDFDSYAPEERHDPELLARLREGMGPHYLDRMRKRWRLVKGTGQDAWRRKDWTWWEPGDMVSWLEVYPDDFNLTFHLDGATYWANDMYCINPGCGCKEVGLAFHRISSKGPKDLGAVSVTLPSCRFSGLMGNGGDERLLEHLWSTMRGIPGMCSVLKDRMKRMKPVGQEIVRLSGGKSMPREPSRLKAGRNAPCPCGSGKKYKKCCLGKD